MSELPPAPPGKRLPPDLRHRPLSILYCDSNVVVVDKLPEFLSVPGRHAESQDCVVARVRDHAQHALQAHAQAAVAVGEAVHEHAAAQGRGR